ncbi:MAG: ATP-binding protein [Candidatus Schekmanbacteria bacterium]|nr:ATP-binding protein [Candidatus Schekmanbacteria bacterium]
MTQDNPLKSGFFPEVPPWVAELVSRHNAGVAHIVLLHGNIDDYFAVGDGYAPLSTLLAELTGRRQIVVSCNVSTGISVRRGAADLVAALTGRSPAALEQRADEVTAALQKLSREPLEMLEVLDRLFRDETPGRRRIAVIFEYFGSLAPAASGRPTTRSEKAAAISLHRWGNDPALRERSPLIVLIERRIGDILPEAFEGNAGFSPIEIPLPAEDARARYVEHFWRTRAAAGLPEARRGLAPCEVARLAGGLALTELEDLLLETWGLGHTVADSEILDRKIEILHRSYGDILEVVRPAFDLSAVGGLDYVKTYLREVASVMKSGERRHVPMGILIMGPPGTGKTFVISCFAKECGLLVVKAKNLRAKYVGESERNQERFFAVITALAPVIVIIDESEQEQGSRDPDRQDHPVDARMRAQGFQFWGDSSHRGSILRIDITNWPRLMDPAMLRSGRTDVKIPVLYPDEAARAAIFAAQCRRHHLVLAADVSHDALAARTDGYSPADLEQVVLLADRFATQDRRPTGAAAAVEARHFEQALHDFMLPRRDRLEIDRMTLQALEECSRRSLVPANAEQIMAELRARGLTP